METPIVREMPRTPKRDGKIEWDHFIPSVADGRDCLIVLGVMREVQRRPERSASLLEVTLKLTKGNQEVVSRLGRLIPLLEDAGWIRATARGMFQCTKAGLEQLPPPLLPPSDGEGRNGA